MDAEENQQIARLTEEEVLFIKRFRNLAEKERCHLIELVKNAVVCDDADED